VARKNNNGIGVRWVIILLVSIFLSILSVGGIILKTMADGIVENDRIRVVADEKIDKTRAMEDQRIEGKYDASINDIRRDMSDIKVMLTRVETKLEFKGIKP
jgi:hypothetical protein